MSSRNWSTPTSWRQFGGCAKPLALPSFGGSTGIARLAFGNGVVIVADHDPDHGRAAPDDSDPRSHSIMVKVESVDAHYDHARQRGARILSPPTDHSYGERQYSAEDLAGHRWTFTQAIADLAPEDWGGTSKTRPAHDQ